jgi:hypothetical protein
VRCNSDDDDLGGRIDVENAVLEPGENTLPDQPRDWRTDLWILTHGVNGALDVAHKPAGRDLRVRQKVTDMLLKFLLGLFQEAVRFQPLLTRSCARANTSSPSTAVVRPARKSA